MVSARGLDKLIGPYGFTIMDGNCLLIDGFEHRPAFGQPYNPKHYVNFIEQAGFATNREILSGYINEATDFPDRIHELSALVQKRRGLHVAHYHTHKDLQALLPHFYEKNL